VTAALRWRDRCRCKRCRGFLIAPRKLISSSSAQHSIFFPHEAADCECGAPDIGECESNPTFLLPRPANFFHPALVTAQIVETVGNCGVAAADPVRLLWLDDGWFNSSHSDAWRSVVYFRRSSRSFAVAHLACLVSVRDTRCRVHHREQQCHNGAIIVDKHVWALRWASHSMSR
jgi:hypothetical protein